MVAFLSLHGQVVGLIGRDGIAPAADYLTELSAWGDDSGATRERIADYAEVCGP